MHDPPVNKMLEKYNNSILINGLQGKYCPCCTGGSNQRTDAEAECGLESFGLLPAYSPKMIRIGLCINTDKEMVWKGDGGHRVRLEL
jgi:hypothetical protein